MKKIGITTFYKAHNYGAMLQTFALYKKINKKNNVEILNYYDKKIYNQYRVIRFSGDNAIKFFRSLVKDIITLNIKKIKRYNNFERFIKNKLNLSKKFSSEKKLKGEKLDYNILITGSDQVWNMQITKGLSDIYTLNLGNKNIKRISYAASVGDSSLIAKNRGQYKNKIENIDFISVRETDAKNELNKLIKKDIEVVLDPTLLLEKSEWNNEIENIKNINQRYILAYVVEPDEEYIKIVNDLVEKTGLKVLHFGLNNPGYKNVLKSAYIEGPLEFVNYIKNAEYVVSTSFHATVFSVIFNKKFFIVPHRKTGSRVTDLLKKLEIKNRVYYSLDEFKSIDYDLKTDWENVERILNEEREKSINWLENAIEG